MKRLTMKYNKKNAMFPIDLSCQFDTRNNFYGKARVVQFKNGCSYLISYNTIVAAITVDNKGNQTAHIRGQYSQTTTRHQKEYLKQNGFYADNVKQMLTDYLSDKLDWEVLNW